MRCPKGRVYRSAHEIAKGTLLYHNFGMGPIANFLDGTLKGARVGMIPAMAKSYTKLIAKVESTFLGIEDHGMFTAMIHVSYGGSNQGIGGFALDRYVEATRERRGTEYGMEWIRRFLNAAGVDSWEKLRGRTFYVLKDGNEWDGKVIGVAPLPTEKGEEFLFASISDLA